MSVRKISLIGDENKRFDLTNGDVFAHTPTGLGAQFSGNDSVFGFATKAENYEAVDISFDLIFGVRTGNGYGSFKNFASFLNSDRLILAIETKATGELHCEVELAELTKSEITLGNAGFGQLQESLTLRRLSPFYFETKSGNAVNPTGDFLGKVYWKTTADDCYYLPKYIYNPLSSIDDLNRIENDVKDLTKGKLLSTWTEFTVNGIVNGLEVKNVSETGEEQVQTFPSLHLNQQQQLFVNSRLSQRQVIKITKAVGSEQPIIENAIREMSINSSWITGDFNANYFSAKDLESGQEVGISVKVNQGVSLW